MVFSVIKHKNLNTESSPCNDDLNYNFKQCLLNHLVRKIGCKRPWDKWSSQDIKFCSDVRDLKKHSNEDILLYVTGVLSMINSTGCLKPCSYTEYKMVGSEKYNIEYELEGMEQAKNVFQHNIYFYATEEITILKELRSYSGLSLLADIGGSLGMFLGFSFLSLWDLVEAFTLGTLHNKGK